MNSITAVMVLNRWPRTLHSTLATLHPFVDKKVAVVDPRSGLTSLDRDQLSHFDAVRESRSETLDQIRNESLYLAREVAGDSFALVIDSDEFVDAQALARMRATIATAVDVAAFLIPQYNYVGHGRWATAYGFRLFDLRRPINYHHKIHESISSSLTRHGLSWHYLAAPIQHLDFLEPVAGKRAQYKTLLARATDEGHDLAFLKTLYAMECFWEGDEARAIQLLDEAIIFATDPAHSSRFSGRDDFPVALKAQYLLHRGDYGTASTLFKHLLEKAEPRAAAEAALGLSHIASCERRNLEALQWIDVSLARWESSEALFSKATALVASGRPHLAWQNISHGLQLNPMARDHRILAEANPDSLFARQSLLHPDYHGLPALLDRMKETAAAVDRSSSRYGQA